MTLGNPQTAMTGTYRAAKFEKYAVRHVVEAQFRFN